MKTDLEWKQMAVEFWLTTTSWQFFSNFIFSVVGIQQITQVN